MANKVYNEKSDKEEIVLPLSLIWKVGTLLFISVVVLVFFMAKWTQDDSVKSAVNKAVPVAVEKARQEGIAASRKDCETRLPNLIAIRDLAYAASMTKDKRIAAQAQKVWVTYEGFLPKVDRLTEAGKKLPEYTCETRFK